MCEVKAGGRYYLMIHAYHHVLCEVVELLGPQRARVKRVRWVYSCRRGWTEFFRDGCQKDTTVHAFPDGEVSWFAAFEWRHEIP